MAGSSTASPAPRPAGNEEPAPTYDRAEVIWHDVERELISREQAEEMLHELAGEENEKTSSAGP
jgi:hypothetical protein